MEPVWQVKGKNKHVVTGAYAAAAATNFAYLSRLSLGSHQVSVRPAAFSALRRWRLFTVTVFADGHIKAVQVAGPGDGSSGDIRWPAQ